MFDGRIIELPDGMTAEEARRLETEALAAKKKLGQGPPPQPVPDVKKLDVKEDRKTELKPPRKKKFGKGAKGGVRPGAAASGLLKAVGKSKVAQYLAAKAAPVVGKGFGKLEQLRKNQQTHDDGDEKRVQSEKAVLIPDSEGQSKSNTGQVNVVGDRPQPKVDAAKGKQVLQEQLRENIPKNIEDVDNFKRDKKAQHTGAEVMKVVQADKSAVVFTFQDMRNTPPPAPREHEPEQLPPTEKAPPTNPLALGKDGIAPLQKEHTDVSNFTKDADKKLTEEGVTQEQLDMVDSGDLAAANKEKKGMEATAKTEPIAVQKFAQQENQKVEKDLKQEETKQRAQMNSKRKSTLGNTGERQKTAKSALEKKREEVAAKINGMYTTAQNNVKQKLDDLEIRAMKRFDDGNAAATKQFENDVNRELEIFKADRYSGFFGWARKAKDWLLGMDDLPGVKAIFERNREKFVSTINKLVEDISADNKKVIDECKDELQRARKQITEFVDGLEPKLKEIGKKAADEMSSKLDQMDALVAKREKDLQDQLKDKQTAAIKAIDEKIEKMKEAMSGALAKLGALLLWAAKKFFTWALQKFGFSLGEIENIINKGVAVLKAIFTKPIKFVKNLMTAAITGFKQFSTNFLKHLQNALFEWLTGSLEGFTLPTKWDLGGIVKLALQMIGISYPNLRRHMVNVMTEPVVARLEDTFALVKTLIKEGPMAAWEQLKDIGGDIEAAFIKAIKDFIKQKIVEQAVIWIASLLIPGAGIIKAIIGIYDTIVFFIKRAKDIIKMIGNFLSSISEIASGNIAAAADAMEDGLAKGLSLVIGFLAALLRLSGITAKIRDAIQSVRIKVDQVLEKVAKWVAEKAKPLLAMGAGVVKKGVDIGKAGIGKVKSGVAALVQWWKKRKKFTAADGSTHSLVYRGEGRKAQLWIESDPTTFEHFINSITSPTDPAAHKEALKIARKMDTLRNRASVTDGTLTEADISALEKLWNDLAEQVALLFAGGQPDKPFYAAPASPVGWGSGMVILKLSKPKPGTKPAVSNRIFEHLNLRRYGTATAPSKASYYILGHLLNQNLGGPGETWENLTPLSRSGNAQHETQVESKVKEVAKKKIVRYEVQARYGRGASPLVKKIPESTKDEMLKNRRNVLIAEQYVPTSLLCRAYTVSPTGKRAPGLDLTREVLNKVETDSLDDYAVEGQAVLRVKTLAINDSIAKAKSSDKHRQALLLLPGIGPSRVDDLIGDTKPWQSFRQIWENVSGVTEDTVEGWRQGLEDGGKVQLNGKTEWEE